MNNYSKELEKVSDIQFTFPILDTENIGNSLSSVNYNFKALDIQTCNLEFSAQNYWNRIYNDFSTISSNWVETINAVRANSSCWNDTYNTVSTLSSVWLKPISLIYPYPFEASDDNSIVTTVQTWLNENIPVKSGTCFNFIVGQELYVFTPQYTEINRILSQTKFVGVKTIKVKFIYSCIGKGKRVAYRNASIDCGSSNLDVSVPDKYVERYSGLRFVINENTYTWSFDSLLYN